MSARPRRSRTPRPRSRRARRERHAGLINSSAYLCNSVESASPACAGDDTMRAPWPSTPRVFTIPASAPFLPTLIEALMDGPAGLGLSSPAAIRWRSRAATLYLPTRRACRLARDVFLDVLKRDAAILPRIVPLGDVDEDELAFAEAAIGERAARRSTCRTRSAGSNARLLLARADPEMGRDARAARRRRRAAGRQQPGRGAGARRRSRAADGRHDDAAGGVGAARRAGAGRPRRYWQLTLRLPEDRARALAGASCRSEARSSRPSARPADRGRSASALRPAPAR